MSVPAGWRGSLFCLETNSSLPSSGCSLSWIRNIWPGGHFKGHGSGIKGIGEPTLAALNLILGPLSVLQSYRGFREKKEGLGETPGKTVGLSRSCKPLLSKSASLSLPDFHL